jgi:hypothetical protein
MPWMISAEPYAFLRFLKVITGMHFCSLSYSRVRHVEANEMGQVINALN